VSAPQGSTMILSATGANTVLVLSTGIPERSAFQRVLLDSTSMTVTQTIANLVEMETVETVVIYIGSPAHQAVVLGIARQAQ